MTVVIKCNKNGRTINTIYGCSAEVVEHLTNTIDKELYSLFVGE